MWDYRNETSDQRLIKHLLEVLAAGEGAPVSPTDIIKGGVDFIMGPPVSPAEPPPNYEDLYYAEALQRAAAEERAAQAEQKVADLDHANECLTIEMSVECQKRGEAEARLAQLEQNIQEMSDQLYREADALDRETGDNKDDLIRAGRQSACIDHASQLAALVRAKGKP